MYITLCYNVICVNYDECGYLYVQYKYNRTLYNLIIRKYTRFFYMCVYCYHVIIIFCYKVNNFVSTQNHHFNNHVMWKSNERVKTHWHPAMKSSRKETRTETDLAHNTKRIDSTHIQSHMIWIFKTNSYKNNRSASESGFTKTQIDTEVKIEDWTR